MEVNVNKAKIALRNLSGRLMSYSTLIIGALILISMLIWSSHKLRLNKSNCKNMDNMIKKQKKLNNLSDFIPGKDEEPAIRGIEKFRRLGDYFIKTAYNCCCAGNYKNDFVNICALKNCIKEGARCLDFEVYSVKNNPVIAASSVNDITIKETYNSVPFENAMFEIENSAFSIAPNSGDPVFINLRIMSKNKIIYNKMAKIIKNMFGGRVLGNCNTYNNHGSNISDIPIGSLIKVDAIGKKQLAKVVILVDFEFADEPFVKETDLWEYINGAANDQNSPFYAISRFTSVKNENAADMKNNNKDNMTMCIPDLNNKAENYNFLDPLTKGCQFVGMCFQKGDAQMRAYHDFFSKEGSAIVKKSVLGNDLLKLKKCIKKPKKTINYLAPLSWSASDSPALDKDWLGDANLSFSV
tara:strand:+ start:1346 stop:2578 length:1233 start_codon:yes stop_codon:yes gene_type:complete